MLISSFGVDEAGEVGAYERVSLFVDYEMNVALQWYVSKHGWVKLDVDGAVRPLDEVTVVGDVIRLDRGGRCHDPEARDRDRGNFYAPGGPWGSKHSLGPANETT
ncbi:hypothetical protein V6N13_026663 [Hibiscus sabdariffa]